MELGLSGFELELIAPPGQSRKDLAQALARRCNGTVRCGMKMLTLTIDDRGDWLGSCELVPAYRVIDSQGRLRFQLEDDFSINAELDVAAAPSQEAWRLTCDDSRLAGLAERQVSGDSEAEVLQNFLLLFSAHLDPPLADHPGLRPIVDSYGHLVAVHGRYGKERERVCEVVTRPLHPEERREVLESVIEEANALGFGPAKEGSVHVHYDAEPWRDPGTLCHLIQRWSSERTELLAKLEPNPATPQWRGGFSSEVQAVADQGADLPFTTLATNLLKAGLKKRSDLNLLGIARPGHRQATLETRVLPMSLDLAEFWSKLEILEAFLQDCL